jgi:biopolymer transport protein TolR
MAFEVAANRSGPRKDVNVTPLIDVVLVLLIIFMVLTPTMLAHLKPTIARESNDSALPVRQPVAVELAADGQLKVNAEAVDWDHLQDTVRGQLAHSRQTSVFFSIADQADYGRAIRLMDLCRGAGAEVLGIPRSRAQ